MPHSATSKIAAEQPVTSGTETVTSQTNALTSEAQTEALHKAFHNLREAIDAPDTSVETIVEENDKFAANYDKTLVVGALHKKELAVDEFVSLLKNNKDALILDLAAGTGIIGHYLCNLGYKNLVALEPSQGMINEAKKKNIYKEFILEIMNAEPTSIKEETFDAVIAVGTLSWNHVSDDALPEILRITKKGGYIVFLNPTKCVEPFEPSMDRLVQEGAWSMLNRKLVPDYLKGIEGVLQTFQKSL